MCHQKDRIVCVDPSYPPKLSALLGVPAHKPSTTDVRAQEAFFRKLLDGCQKEYPDGGRLMVMDEADMYFTKDGRGYGCMALKEIAHTGRGCYLSQIYLSRSPLDVSRSQRGLFNLLLIGRNTENRAGEWWEDFTGIEGFGAFLRDLPEDKHQFVAYATDQTPHIIGIWSVQDGEIACQDWIPPEEEEANGDEDSEEEAPAPTEDIDEAPSPGESASTPDAERPSPTGSASPIAKSTE